MSVDPKNEDVTGTTAAREGVLIMSCFALSLVINRTW
jgi:hypothetical protein